MIGRIGGDEFIVLIPGLRSREGAAARGQALLSTLQAPIRTYASSCPAVAPMIANATGNCSLGACHGENAKVSLAP